MHLVLLRRLAVNLVGREDCERAKTKEPLVLFLARLVVEDGLGHGFPEDDMASPMPLLHVLWAFADVVAETLPHGERPPPAGREGVAEAVDFQEHRVDALVGRFVATLVCRPGWEPPTGRHGRRQGSRFCSRAAMILAVTSSRICVWLAGIVAPPIPVPYTDEPVRAFLLYQEGRQDTSLRTKSHLRTATGSQVA